MTAKVSINSIILRNILISIENFTPYSNCVVDKEVVPKNVLGLGWMPVGEFRKTRHPRNAKFDKVLETCFSGTRNSRFSEAWNL
jgi:hypothetical protein